MLCYRGFNRSWLGVWSWLSEFRIEDMDFVCLRLRPCYWAWDMAWFWVALGPATLNPEAYGETSPDIMWDPISQDLHQEVLELVHQCIAVVMQLPQHVLSI